MGHMNSNQRLYKCFYRQAKREMAKWRDDYAEEVRVWDEEGEGMPPNWVTADTQPWFDPEWDYPDRMVNIGGEGHRYPYCIHGANLWVDHDIPCGYCEMETDDREVASANARARLSSFLRRSDWLNSAPAELAMDESVVTLRKHLLRDLTNWGNFDQSI